MNKILFPLTLLSTYLLLALGALLQLRPSLKHCQTWPHCSGEASWYEFSHRAIAGIVLIGTLFLCLSWWKKKKDIKVFWPLILVLTEALLGALTFLHRLPLLETSLHLFLSLLFLMTLVTYHTYTFEPELEQEPSAYKPWLKDLLLWGMGLLVFQILSGGWWRKAGGLFKCEVGESFWQCWSEAKIPSPLKEWIWFHRGFGLFLAFALLLLLARLLSISKIRGVVILSMFLLVFQLFSGWLMGKYLSTEQMTWLHFLCAILNLGLITVMWAHLRNFEWKKWGRPIPTAINDVMDLFKPKLTILVVVTVLVGVFLAPLPMTPWNLVLSLLGVWLQAAGSLCLNCYLEKDVDAKMERTKDRPLPAGRLAPEFAFIIGWVIAILGTFLVGYFGNWLTAMLGVFALVSYLYLYTPMKLITPYALFVGAVPGALPTLMGWTVVMGEIGEIGIFLFMILFLWQIPHFIAISIYRGTDYSNAHIKTFAQTLSPQFLKWIVLLFSFLLGLAGVLPAFSYWRGELYQIISYALMFVTILFSLLAWRAKDQTQFIRWGKHYFWWTLAYLPLQLGAFLLLR